MQVDDHIEAAILEAHYSPTHLQERRILFEGNHNIGSRHESGAAVGFFCKIRDMRGGVINPDIYDCRGSEEYIA